MVALKSYIPAVSKVLEKSPDQLNEWLRALVKTKALAARPGRGPGSGVELSSETLAVFLIALLCSDIRNQAATDAKRMAKSPPLGQRPCPVSGATTLVDAIAAGLSGRAPAQLREISVIRGEKIAHAELKWLTADGYDMPVFFYGAGKVKPGPLSVARVLHEDAIVAIANGFREIANISGIAPSLSLKQLAAGIHPRAKI